MLQVLAAMIFLLGLLAVFQGLGTLRSAQAMVQTLTHLQDGSPLATLLHASHQSIVTALLFISTGVALLVIAFISRIRSSDTPQPAPQNLQQVQNHGSSGS